MPTRLIILLAAVALAAATARLGVWQLDRAAQKTALQERIDSRRALPALAPEQLPRSPAEAAWAQDRLARVQGQWLPQHTVYLDNRQLDGRPGFHVVTPLRLADGGALLVQRGWLPRDVQDRTRIAPYTTPPGSVALQGRIAPALPRLYEFDSAATGPIRQNLDLDGFARDTQLALRPWVLIQDDDGGATSPIQDGLQRRWPVPASGVAKHHGYAFQWFALSALTIGLYVWFQLIRPRRQQRR